MVCSSTRNAVLRSNTTSPWNASDWNAMDHVYESQYSWLQSIAHAAAVALFERQSCGKR